MVRRPAGSVIRDITERARDGRAPKHKSARMGIGVRDYEMGGVGWRSAVDSSISFAHLDTVALPGGALRGSILQTRLGTGHQRGKAATEGK
jgi:hypothetical protein